MLDAFLETMACRPFDDGKTDCILTVADWIVLNGHPDPAEPYRGRYSTALGRERLQRRLGGLRAVMDAGAFRSGLSCVRRAKRGDVGLIRSNGEELAAICLGRLWAAQGAGLMVARPQRILKAWRV